MIRVNNSEKIQTNEWAHEQANLHQVEKAGPQKEGRLTLYEEHLNITSPTYSEEIKEVMKKEEIEESNLNANIIKTMTKSGLNVTKDALGTIVNQLQEEDLFRLFEEGYHIEDLTAQIIAKEVMKSESFCGPGKEKKNSIDEDVAQALVGAGLPETKKNIEILSQYKEKLESVIGDQDLAISNMVRHKLELTVNNLYSAKHRGTPKDQENPAKEEDIVAVLNMNGIKVSHENINAATSLIKGKIEITKANVEDFIMIQETVNLADPQKLIKQAAKEMKKGEKPGDLKISQELISEGGGYEYDEIKQIVEDIHHIDKDHIEKTYEKGKPITIGNLQQSLHENIEKILKGKDEAVTGEGPEITEKIETTKRQIEEIRLSLTLEAALKLNSKLDIKTSDLTKLVEALKVMEKHHNEDILTNMGIPVTSENLEQMQETSERIINISHNKEFAVAKVVEGEADFNLKGMDEAIKLKQAQYAQEIYEERGSRPERRFGEGINKVQEQISHILEMNEIEPTPSNIKAAKALVENRIDLTVESVEMARSLLVKVETVLYELRPVVVAKMIQEGIRPDTMPIDQLIDRIHGMEEERGIDPKQKLAEAILDLDKTGELNPKEREGLVAVYRMLNTITKNETAAIGFLLGHRKEPTLGNLFEASKYIKQTGGKSGKMDLKVNDDLGIREGDLPNNIRSLIEEATKSPVASQTIKNVVDQWLSRITPDQLKAYIDWDKPLEELELQEGKRSPLEVEKTTKQVGALDKLSPHTISFLEEKGIALTIPNLYWIDKMIKDPHLLGDLLKEYEDVTGEKIETSIHHSKKESLEEILEALEDELEKQSPKWLSAPDSAQAYNMGKDLEQMLQVQKQFSQNEGIYQVPVELHHGMSNLNVYVMKDKEGKSRADKNEINAYMSIKTKNLGVIQVKMRISDKAVGFEMIGETPAVTLGLQKGSKELKAAIEKTGFNVMQAKFSQGETRTSIGDRPKGSDALAKYRFEDSKFEHII